MTKPITMRERMLAVYRNQSPDRSPVSIYTRYLPRGSTEREIRNIGLGIIDYQPVVSLLAPPWHILPGYLSEVKGAEFDIQYRFAYGEITQRRTYKTPVGTIYQDVSRYIGAGSEHISKYYITCAEDYRVMQYLVENTVFRGNESAIRQRTEDLGQDGVVLGRVDRCPHQKILIELAGAQQFLIDLYTRPEPALELMDAMDRRMDEAFEMIVESDVEVIWQPDNITSDLTPPDAFEKYCLPYYRKHGRQAREAGKPYIVHMDGKVKALKHLINQADFDAIESLSFPEIGGDMTLPEARDAFPSKVILPNFPANLCSKSDTEIEAFLDALLTEAGTETPFMLQISEDLPEGEWHRVLPIICRVMNRESPSTK